MQLVGLRFNLMLIWTFISRFISGVQGPTSPLQQCNKRSMIDSSRKEITFLKISRKEITFLEISCKKGSKFYKRQLTVLFNKEFLQKKHLV